jgi:hypothetical protein
VFLANKTPIDQYHQSVIVLQDSLNKFQQEVIPINVSLAIFIALLALSIHLIVFYALKTLIE